MQSKVSIISSTTSSEQEMGSTWCTWNPHAIEGARRELGSVESMRDEELTREANDGISADRGVWHVTPDVVDDVTIPLMCITTLHTPQYVIVSTLEWLQ